VVVDVFLWSLLPLYCLCLCLLLFLCLCLCVRKFGVFFFFFFNKWRSERKSLWVLKEGVGATRWREVDDPDQSRAVESVLGVTKMV
jgi:hypothetical protein